jgi:hypothetical protein
MKSLARPDGNTMSVRIIAVDLDGKRQDILIEAVPGLRRMAALAKVNNSILAVQAIPSVNIGSQRRHTSVSRKRANHP